MPADSVLGLQVERTITSETAKVEDKVSARVTRDVRVVSRVAIPAGSIVSGSVTEVDRGGKMKGKARLAVRFHTVTLADGTQLAVRTDAVVREGESPARETAAKASEKLKHGSDDQVELELARLSLEWAQARLEAAERYNAGPAAAH